MNESVSYRQLTRMDELVNCALIEEQVWGEGIVPPHMLRAVTSMGGLAVGAFDRDTMIGFVFGFRGVLQRSGTEIPVHHSHVAAVLPGYRGQGIGVGLKRTQARLALQQGLQLMTWTFDPLRARNAHLNIEKLGATVQVYEPDYYGNMTDAQNGQLASDRLLAEWQLTGEQSRPRASASEALKVLQAAADGSPAAPQLQQSAELLHVAVPRDLDELLRSRPDVADAWRAAVRSTLMHYLDAGYLAAGFRDNGYVLHRS